MYRSSCLMAGFTIKTAETQESSLIGISASRGPTSKKSRFLKCSSMPVNLFSWQPQGFDPVDTLQRMIAAFSDRISSSPSNFAKLCMSQNRPPDWSSIEDEISKFWSLMFPRGSDYSPGRQATNSRGLQNSIVPGKSPNRRCKVTLHLYEYGVYQMG